MKMKLIVGCVVAVIPCTGFAQQKQVAVHPELSSLFTYLDTDGQQLSVSDDKQYLEDMARLADQLLAPSMKKKNALNQLSFLKIIQILGADKITATGSSSKQHGNFHTKKFFIETKDNNRGVFSLLGSKPNPYVAAGFAPAGSDLVIETQLNLSRAVETTFDLLRIFKPDAVEGNKKLFDVVIPGSDSTVKEFVSHLDARISIVVELDLRSRNVPFKATARIDDSAKYIWSVLGENIKKDIEVETKGNVHRFTVPVEGISLTFIFDLDADHLWISMDEAHLATCMGKGKKLAASETYQLATKGLPKLGSSELYISRNVITTLTMLAESQIPADSINGELRETWNSIKKTLAGSNGVALRIQKNKEGILIAGNTPYRIRNMNLLYATPVLASIATPVIMQKLRDADRAKTIMNLKQLGLAIMDYSNTEGAYPSDLDELVKGSYLLGEVKVFTTYKSDEGRAQVVYLAGNKTGDNAIILYTPKPITGKYVYALKDGSVQVATEAEFKRFLAAAKKR